LFVGKKLAAIPPNLYELVAIKAFVASPATDA
jgi:hypothetical protein